MEGGVVRREGGCIRLLMALTASEELTKTDTWADGWTDGKASHRQEKAKALAATTLLGLTHTHHAE